MDKNCLMLRLEKIFLSRNVVFYENIFPCRSLINKNINLKFIDSQYIKPIITQDVNPTKNLKGDHNLRDIGMSLCDYQLDNTNPTLFLPSFDKERFLEIPKHEDNRTNFRDPIRRST